MTEMISKQTSGISLPKEENLPIPINRKILLIYTIIPSIVLTFPAILSFDPELWIIQGIDHFYFEMFGILKLFIDFLVIFI